MYLNLRLAFHHEIQTRERTSHVFPVPVAVVFGISHVESIYVELVDRIVHGAKLRNNIDILLPYIVFLLCFPMFFMCFLDKVDILQRKVVFLLLHYHFSLLPLR